jgi:dephospho-CoA kinase
VTHNGLTHRTKRIVVGLTGNIATGKSAVMRFAAEQGALAIDADKVVHHIMDNDASMQAAIAVAFGSDVRRQDGTIDRARLASIVFSDPAALHDLELMMHPAVRVEILERIQASDADVVFIEAIKLLEGPLREQCDQVWVTDCSNFHQIQRLMICRGMDDETAALRVNSQAPQADKLAQADVVINTEGTMAETRQQVEEAWSALPFHLLAPQPVAVDDTDRVADDAESVTVDGDTASDAVPTLLVRRARPSDLPAILLLIQRATGGGRKMKRAELLMAMSERSYLIGQIESEICAVVGFAIESGLARIEELYFYPAKKATSIGKALLAEVEQSASQHICEAIFAFPQQSGPEAELTLFTASGFEHRTFDDLPRAWRRALDNSQPDGSTMWVKTLRDVRIA